MADKQPVKSKPKRQVKDPETFRERALKAAETPSGSEKPEKPARSKRGKRSKLPKPLRLIGRIIFPTYFRDSWRELKQVTWPNWQQSRQLTFAVLLFAVVFGAIIAAVDYGLDKVFRNVLLK